MFEISHTSNLFIRKKNPMELNFLFGGRNFFWGEGSFMGGDIEYKVLGGKVQSPESSVQGPGSRVQSSF